MKMKKLNQFALFAIFVAMISACTPKAGGDYTQVIPVEATTVVALDLNSMSDKAGLNDQDNQVFKEKILEAMTSGLKPTSVAHIEKIMKDPSESGISSKDPIYVFISPTTKNPVIVAKISNEKKLLTTLDVMAEEQIGDPVMKRDGLSIMKTSDMFVAFNNTSVILGDVNRSFQEDEIIGYLKTKSEESIHQSPYFQKMQNRKGDILFFSSLDAYSRQMMRTMGTPMPAGMDLSEFFFIGDLSFEKGKIVSHFEYATENEEFNKLLETNSKSLGKIKGSFISDFPSTPLMLFSINLKGDEFFKSLMSNEEFNKAMQGEEGTLIHEFIKAFNGDVSFALLDVTMTDMPAFVAYAETNDNSAFDVIYKNKDKFGLRSGDDIVQLSENQYQYKSRNMSFYFGIKDKRAYITNDQAIYQGTSLSTSLKDARYASKIKGKIQFAVVDVDAILALPVVQMLAGFGGSEYKTILDILKKFSYLEATSANHKEAEIILHMTDKDTNTLKQIVDMAKQFSGM